MTPLLSDPSELAYRRTLAGAARLADLRPFLAGLRARHGEVPDPDPLDGGAEARLLLLLETPGPRIRASMIVSRDNPSGTGRNLRAMLDAAGIARRDTLIWNVVPWIIHREGAPNRAPSRAELAEGLGHLDALLAALPHLAVVVLSGRFAAQAEPTIATARPGLPILAMPHPSPTIQCTSPEIRRRCAAALAEAAVYLDLARRAEPLSPPPRGEGSGVGGIGSESRSCPASHPALRSARATLPAGRSPDTRGRDLDQPNEA